MKYNLIGNNNILSPLETVLHNRGIEGVEQFLKAGEDSNSEHCFTKLKNIGEAVIKLNQYIKNKEKQNVFFQIDSDIDGLLSSAMFIRYLKKVAPQLNIQHRQHKGKQHGIRSKDVPDGTDIVVIPDAATNDIAEHKKLVERSIEVLIVDHHELEGEESPHAIIVNNQMGSYPNPHLSATGVVYKVLRALDSSLGVSYANEYIDMAAIGIIGDMMLITPKENRYYVTQGLKNIKNPLIKELFKEQEYSTKGVISPMTVSFYIAPLFNALIRSGTSEEKDQMFKSLLDDGKTEVYYERGKRDEPLITNTIRMMKRVRQRQNKAVATSVEQINERIEEKNLLDNKLLIVEVTGMLDSNFTGLVANRLLNDKRVKRPVLLLRYDEEADMLNGSARGYDSGYIKDFKQFLSDSGYFEYNLGHANAFGTGVKKEKLIEFNEKINEDMKDIEIGSTSYEVDFILTPKQIKKSLIEELDSYKDLWGRGVAEPLIAIQTILVDKQNVQLLGKNKNTIKFTSNGIEYMKFFTNEEEYNEWMNMGSSVDALNFNVVGKVGLNIFRGRSTGQIVIEDYEVSSEEKGLPF